MSTLYWHTTTATTLADALHDALHNTLHGTSHTDAIGMISTTAWHGFVTLTTGAGAGITLDRPDGAVPLETVFEARVFSPGPTELRWLHDPDTQGGLGTAVLLSEQQHPDAESSDIHTTFEQTHLLWGTPEDAQDANGSGGRWSTLREHRTGALPVPLPPPADSGVRAVLTTREYVTLDEYGNAYVLDELITGLTWQRPKEWTTAKGEEKE